MDMIFFIPFWPILYFSILTITVILFYMIIMIYYYVILITLGWFFDCIQIAINFLNIRKFIYIKVTYLKYFNFIFIILRSFCLLKCFRFLPHGGYFIWYSVLTEHVRRNWLGLVYGVFYIFVGIYYNIRGVGGVFITSLI